MFKTYKASAGSGKTTNLVAEYLSICLPDPTMYEHILAITFTNAATAEMKERILQTLNDFAFIQPIILLDEKNKSFSRSRCIYHIIKKINPVLTDESIQNNSLRLLEKILTDYPKFTVNFN